MIMKHTSLLITLRSNVYKSRHREKDSQTCANLFYRSSIRTSSSMLFNDGRRSLSPFHGKLGGNAKRNFQGMFPANVHNGPALYGQ